MNTIFLARASSLLGLAALTVICSGLSAQAEPPNTVVSSSSATPLAPQSIEFQAAQADPAPADEITQIASSAANKASATTASESTDQVLDPQLALEPADVLSQQDNFTALNSSSSEQSELTAKTSDNTAETTLASKATGQASDLMAEPSGSQSSKTTSKTKASTVAQELPSEIRPGRATASSSSYFGIGGNFGVFGGSSLGSQSLSLFSKVGIARYFSVRPSVLVDFTSDATFLVPVTLDLPAQSLFLVPGLEIAPYVGGGLAASTSDGIGGAVLAGIDWPVNPDFTVTSGVNIGFIDDFNLGVQIGIGYNFNGF